MNQKLLSFLTGGWIRRRTAFSKWLILEQKRLEFLNKTPKPKDFKYQGQFFYLSSCWIQLRHIYGAECFELKYQCELDWVISKIERNSKIKVNPVPEMIDNPELLAFLKHCKASGFDFGSFPHLIFEIAAFKKKLDIKPGKQFGYPSGYMPQQHFMDGTPLSGGFFAIPVQVNGVLADQIHIPLEYSISQIESAAKNLKKVKVLLEGKTVVKITIVPWKLVNIETE